jgi:hypothetical protein
MVAIELMIVVPPTIPNRNDKRRVMTEFGGEIGRHHQAVAAKWTDVGSVAEAFPSSAPAPPTSQHQPLNNNHWTLGAADISALCARLLQWLFS